jgi:hypothetical protein
MRFKPLIMMNKIATIYSTLKVYALLGTAVFALSQCADEEIISPTPASETISEVSAEAGAALSLSISGIHTFSTEPVACKTCTYIVASDETVIDGEDLGIKAGDIICLDAAKRYGSLEFVNIYGTLEKPVIIANTDSRKK